MTKAILNYNKNYTSVDMIMISTALLPEIQIDIDSTEYRFPAPPLRPAPSKVTFFFQENKATIQCIMTCG